MEKQEKYIPILNYLINECHSENLSEENIEDKDFIFYDSNKLFDFQKSLDENYSGKTKIELNYEKENEELNINNKILIYEGNNDQKLFKIENKKNVRPENLKIRIKVHFHKFIYSFFKDLIKDKFQNKNCKIRKISYSITKKNNKEHNKLLLNMSMEEFLSQSVSPSFKCAIGQNKKNIKRLKKLIGNSEEIQFLKMRYKDFFKRFYLSNEQLNINFKLSSSTQFFSHFLNSLNDKEKKLVNILVQENNFFNEK
jgi:hypothetical protein